MVQQYYMLANSNVQIGFTHCCAQMQSMHVHSHMFDSFSLDSITMPMHLKIKKSTNTNKGYYGTN